MNISTVPVSSLKSVLPATLDWLVCSVSFDARSYVIPACVTDTSIKVLAFFHKNHEYLKGDVDRFKMLFPDGTFAQLNSSLPVRSFDVMRQVIAQELSKGGAKRVGIDITSFTREALAMLLVILKHLLPCGSTITCLYTKAADYAEDRAKGEREAWFSRGIADIRSILGYRGSIRLLGKTHLILMPGFEVERAQSIVDALEPDRLTFGQIIAGESVQPHFAVKANAMLAKLELYFPDRVIEHFNFSAKNPYVTMESVKSCVLPEENTVIACLNTKVAMAGVCMAAINHPSIQLIYAQPLNYNTCVNVTPDSEVLQFDFS